MLKSNIKATSPETTTPTGNYLKIGSLNLYYEIRGSGEPLVLLHGGLLTNELAWADLLPSFAQTRQVIAVELEGHGHTALLDRSLSYEQMADDVGTLISHLGIERTDIFGFSLGGGVAWQTAIRHPELVRKLIVTSAPIKRDGWFQEMLEAVGGLNVEIAKSMEDTPLCQSYSNVAPNPDDWPTLVTKIAQVVDGEYDWSGDVSAITASTLVIIGDSDSFRPEHAVEVFKLLGGGVPGDFGPLPPSQLAVLPGTPHSGLLSRADLLLPVMLPFLDAAMPGAR